LRASAHHDQAWVEKLCGERKIPLHIEILNPSRRAAGQSVEMWGRERRYAAFAKTRKAVGADAVLTAHHRDDVVETLCLRLWRGTGLAGLAGIPFQREGGILRPLLPMSRRKLKSWLLSIGTRWVEDETNLDLDIPRNWVRHQLLPAWRKSEPRLDARLFNLARKTSELLPAWNRWFEESFPASEVREKGGIPVEWLQNGADPEMLRRLLPILGAEKAAPEALAEIFRQSAKSEKGLRVRLDPTTVLAEKRGLLTVSKGFRP
jgi:tRNA(Ile)-lysidine synthetase-like protein